MHYILLWFTCIFIIKSKFYKLGNNSLERLHYIGCFENIDDKEQLNVVSVKECQQHCKVNEEEYSVLALKVILFCVC